MAAAAIQRLGSLAIPGGPSGMEVERLESGLLDLLKGDLECLMGPGGAGAGAGAGGLASLAASGSMGLGPSPSTWGALSFEGLAQMPQMPAGGSAGGGAAESDDMEPLYGLVRSGSLSTRGLAALLGNPGGELDPKHWAAINAGNAAAGKQAAVATPFANTAAIERAAVLAADAVGSAALPMPGCTLPDPSALPISPLTNGNFDLAGSRRLLAAMQGGEVGAEGPRAAGRTAGGKRKNRGGRLSELIKSEEAAGGGGGDDGAVSAYSEEEDDDELQAEELQPSSKRGRSSGGSAGAAGGAGPPGSCKINWSELDDASKTRIKREKNRVAARKCRAKKMQFMVDLQRTLRELLRKNEEYKMQVVTWHKMFSREVRLREGMKRIIQLLWANHSVPMAATGFTANDVVIGLESGSLDVNALLCVIQQHTLSCATDPAPAAGTPIAAAAATAAAGPAGLAAAAAAAAGPGASPLASPLAGGVAGGGPGLFSVGLGSGLLGSLVAGGGQQTGLAAEYGSHPSSACATPITASAPTPAPTAAAVATVHASAAANPGQQCWASWDAGVGTPAETPAAASSGATAVAAATTSATTAGLAAAAVMGKADAAADAGMSTLQAGNA